MNVLLSKKKQVYKTCQKILPRLRRIAMSWGCSVELAEDLTQEACAIALEKHPQIRDLQATEYWIISILNNCHKRHLRDGSNNIPLREELLLNDDQIEESLDTRKLIRQVKLAIASLHDDHRKILTLIDMEGLSYHQTAVALDLKIGTVMSRLSRAREKVRNQVRQQQTGLKPKFPHLVRNTDP